VKLSQDLKTFTESIESPNILITGRTGAGKSTILNAVFGKHLSNTGVAFGILTKSFIRHGAEGDIPLTLFDSPGFEMGREKQFIDDMGSFIDTQQKKGRDGQIHFVWYVVNTPLARFEAFEHELIKRFNKRKIPVIAVMSQCDRASDVERQQMQYLLARATDGMTYEIVSVSANPLEIDGEPVCLAFGLEELVTKTVARLPEAYRHAFVATQIVSIREKRIRAYAYVTAGASICFATGYVPVPFTTAISTYFALKQLAVKLASIYDYAQKKKVAELLAEATKSKEGIAVYVVTSIFNLFLFDPITSTLAGATAAAYLMMVGLALAGTFEEATTLELEGRSRTEIDEQICSIFRNNFQAWRHRINIKSASDLESFKDAFVSGT
jgi:predicted GTPase